MTRTDAPSTAIEHDIGPRGLLAIRLGVGDITLAGTDGTVARVTAAAGDLRAVRVETSPGSLSIGGARGIVAAIRQGAGPDGLALRVEVPRAATVVVETVAGATEAVDLLGDQRYRTASGDVVLEGSGGRIALETVSGDARVTAGTDVDLDLRTVSGDVEVVASSIATFRVSSASGDLRITGRSLGRGPFAVETVSGDTMLAIAGALRAEIQTVTGRISSDLSAPVEGRGGRRTIDVGRGGPTLSIRSMSGDIRLTRPSMAGARVDPDRTLAVLRALEGGEIDVAEATRRLSVAEDQRQEPPDA